MIMTYKRRYSLRSYYKQTEKNDIIKNKKRFSNTSKKTIFDDLKVEDNQMSDNLIRKSSDIPSKYLSIINKDLTSKSSDRNLRISSSHLLVKNNGKTSNIQFLEEFHFSSINLAIEGSGIIQKCNRDLYKYWTVDRGTVITNVRKNCIDSKNDTKKLNTYFLRNRTNLETQLQKKTYAVLMTKFKLRMCYVKIEKLPDIWCFANNGRIKLPIEINRVRTKVNGKLNLTKKLDEHIESHKTSAKFKRNAKKLSKKKEKHLININKSLVTQISIEDLKIYYNIRECHVLLYQLKDQDIKSYSERSIAKNSANDFDSDVQRGANLDKTINVEEINTLNFLNDVELEIDKSESINNCLYLQNIGDKEDYMISKIGCCTNNSNCGSFNNHLYSNAIDGSLIKEYETNISKLDVGSPDLINNVNNYVYGNNCGKLLINENEINQSKLEINSTDYINIRNITSSRKDDVFNDNYGHCIDILESETAPFITFKLPGSISSSVNDSNLLTPVNTKNTQILVNPLSNLSFSSNSDFSSRKRDLPINLLQSPDSDSYDMTPFIPKQHSKVTEENYNIENLSFNDSTDDENFPKKEVPRWASDILLCQSTGQQPIEPPKIFYLRMPATVEEITHDLEQCFSEYRIFCKRYKGRYKQ